MKFNTLCFVQIFIAQLCTEQKHDMNKFYFFLFPKGIRKCMHGLSKMLYVVNTLCILIVSTVYTMLLVNTKKMKQYYENKNKKKSTLSI